MNGTDITRMNRINRQMEMLGFNFPINSLIRSMTVASGNGSKPYPPYNIVNVDEDNVVLEMAVAGFTRDDIDITTQSNELMIEGKTEKSDNDANYVVRNFAKRNFRLKFMIHEHFEVDSADMNEGVLVVNLKKNVPEELLPKKIKIKS